MATVAKARVKWRVLPTSRPGRAASWLTLAFVVWLFLVDVPLAQLRDRGLVPTSLFVAQVMLGFALGLAASILALRAILRSNDRVVLTYASLAPGLFVAAAIVWETFVPH